MAAARTVAANTLAAFQAEMTAFSESLFNTFASKGDDYKRIMTAWHLFAVLTPLIRDDNSDVSCPTAAQKRDLFVQSTSFYHFEKEPQRVENPPPTRVELIRNFQLQESFERLHRLLRPLICTICHARVSVWTFLEHTNVCYEYEMGKRTLLSVNKDLLKFCEEAQTESLKLSIQLLPEAELALKIEIFGGGRTDTVIATYKKSCNSNHSNKSNAISPDKNSRKETYLGDHFEVPTLAVLQANRPAEQSLKDMDRRGQLWALPPRDPNFLRAMAHSNELRMGLNKMSNSDLSKDHSSKRASFDSKNDPNFNCYSAGSESNRYSTSRADRKSSLANPDLVRIPSNSNASKNNFGEAEEDLLGDAFFGNEEASSSGKNSLDRSQGENGSTSRNSTERADVEARLAHSPKRFRESHYPSLGVIDEEEENLVSKRQISPVILFHEKKMSLAQAESDKLWSKKLIQLSPGQCPDIGPKSPSIQDPIDDYKPSQEKSKILGLGLDSSVKFLPSLSGLSQTKENPSASKSPVSKGNNTESTCFNIYQRQSNSQRSIGNPGEKGSNSDVSPDRDPQEGSSAPAPLLTTDNPTLSTPKESERSENDNINPKPKPVVQSSFRKSFRGFHQTGSNEVALYFQPKLLPEAPHTSIDTSNPCEDRNRIGSRSPIRKISINASTMYTKPKKETDTFGIWNQNSTPRDTIGTSFTPVDPDSPSPPKSTNLEASQKHFDIKINKSGPTAHTNPFSFRNSLSFTGKNKDQSSQPSNIFSIQKSTFADASHSNQTSRFPTCRTEYKPVRKQEPKPLQRNEIPFATRVGIWVQANKAATEYKKPKSRAASNQDHLVYILNKRIQEYKSTLLSIASMINSQSEKDLIFDLRKIQDRFEKDSIKQLIGRFIGALKARIDLIEQQHKKQAIIGDLERDFQTKRVFRNKISVSFSNLRSLEISPKRRLKALTALNFEIVAGKIQQKKSKKDSQPQMFLQKLLKMEESSRNVPSIRKKSEEREKIRVPHHLESKSDVELSNQKNNIPHDTSLGDGLSALSSMSKEDLDTSQFQNILPADLCLHKKQAPDNSRIPSDRKEHPSIEQMISANPERRVLKKHPSDSKILEFAEREKLYFEYAKEVCLDNFEFLKEIGKGAYGKVYLATHKPTREIYALKVIQFQEEVSKKFLEEMQNEITILNVIEGEFLAKAFFSFVDRHALCIAMEYLMGGDFRSILEAECRLDTRCTRYYIAQLCVAVEELHSRNIVHRDLKPENILLDKDLKLKLADFGLSEFRRKVETNAQVSNENIVDPRHKKAGSKKNKRLVGTPDYIPPEVLLAADILSERRLEETGGSCSSSKQSPRDTFAGENLFEPRLESVMAPKAGPEPKSQKDSVTRRLNNLLPETQLDEYSSAIDWWGVGCLLYEFLVGVSPFGATTLDEVWQNIKNFNIIWPAIGYGEDCMTPEAKDLILRFLDRDPLKRIGVKNFQEIQNHPFFNGLDWSSLSTSPAPLSLDIKLPSTSKNVKLSMVVPRKPPSMPTYRFDAQDLVISRLDLFYELNIKRVMDVRENHNSLLANHLQLLDRKPSNFDVRDLSKRQRDPESPEL